MISAILLALAGLSVPASGGHAAYAPGTAQQHKGHAPIPAPGKAKPFKGATIACNPDPLKGRACRHHQAKVEQARNSTPRDRVAEAERR